MRALKPVRRIFLASHRVFLLGSRVREDLPTEAFILWVLLTDHLVHVSAGHAVMAAEAEDVVGGNVWRRAKPALEAIRRVELALRRMGIPGVRIGKKLAAEAGVAWVLLAHNRMSISLLAAI